MKHHRGLDIGKSFVFPKRNSVAQITHIKIQGRHFTVYVQTIPLKQPQK